MAGRRPTLTPSIGRSTCEAASTTARVDAKDATLFVPASKPLFKSLSARQASQAFLMCASAALCSSAVSGQELRSEARTFLGPCTGNDAPTSLMDTACETTKAEFLVDYELALRGERAGQRNVAYCLLSGCSRAVGVNRIQACAWRLVIVGSGHSENDEGDTSNLRTACAPLDSADRNAAEARAARLAAEIRPLPRGDLRKMRSDLNASVPPAPSQKLPPCTPGTWGCR